MNAYLLLKSLHIACATASGCFFLLRGAWMMGDPARLQARWVRTLPHAIDTVLLASALGLAFWSGYAPWNSPWLAAKIGLLVAYILCGSMALKRGRTMTVRVVFFVLALCCFSWIVAAARSKLALPFMPL